VGFYQEGRLRKVSMAGGPSIPIAAASIVIEASWNEKNLILFSEAGRLKTVSASGGVPRVVPVTDTTGAHLAPSFLPDGRTAVITIRARGTGVDAAWNGLVDIETGKVDTIGPGNRGRYANGYLVFAGADNTLLAQAFDPGSRKTTGDAVAFIERIAIHGGVTHEFTLSPTGRLVYQPVAADESGDVLRLAGPAGKTVLTLPGRTPSVLDDPAFAPDGRIALVLAAVQASTVGQDVWLFDRQHGTLERFTVGGGSDPAWSRDGKRIAYSRSDGLWVKNSDGTGDARLVVRGAGLFLGNWLPGDTALVFHGNSNPNTRTDIGLISLRDSTPRWIVNSEFRERHPRVSHDGRWVAYSSDRTGRFEVYVRSLAGGGGGPEIPVSTEGGVAAHWSPDDRTLYYTTGETIIAATRAPGPGFSIATRKVAVADLSLNTAAANVNWDLSPNGKEFLYIGQRSGISDRLAWILNWPELVKSMETKR
jgi:Tol biopolymer transport system component